MPYTLNVSEAEIMEKSSYLNAQGHAECVELIRQTTDAPATIRWQKGIKVMDAAASTIARGTAIATFDANGRYPTDSRGRHAAIYLSHDKNGIRVLDQWNSKGKPSQRTIYFKKGLSRSNEGQTFYVIQ